MRHAAFALLGLAFMAGTNPSVAADMPVKAPRAAAPVMIWAGWYIGGNVGYGWGRNTGDDWDRFTDPPGVGGVTLGFQGYLSETGGIGNALEGVSPKGVVGGGQVGRNWQHGQYVVGFVVDGQASRMSASNTVFIDPPLRTPSFQSNSARISWLATARAKFGYAPANWLIYGTGGWAFGGVKTAVVFDCVGGCGHTYAGSQSSVRIGWTAGAGLEHRLTSNWSIGAEYLYFDLGKVSTTAVYVAGNQLAILSTVTADSRMAGSIVRALVNYRFNAGSP